MPAPRDLGWWVAFEATIDAGPKKRDLEVAVDRVKRTGAKWVCLRAGAGGGDDVSFDEESIKAFDEAGIDVYIWIFAYESTAAGEVADYARWAKTGRVKGAIINAEFEYQHAPPAQARKYVRDIRAAGYDYVAHAPPDYLGGRGSSPALAALDQECDGIFPQVYAPEHNDAGHEYHLDQVVALYLARGYGLDKVSPVLGSYRPRTRGYTKNAAGKTVGIPTPHMDNEAEWVANDLRAGLDHVFTMSSLAPSIYSLDAVSWINGPRDRVVSTLEARDPRALFLPARFIVPKEHQRAFAVLGYDLGPDWIDGDIGRKSKAAIASFKNDRGIDEPGVGPMTCIALADELNVRSGRVIPRPFELGPDVRLEPGETAPRGFGDMIERLFPPDTERSAALEVDDVAAIPPPPAIPWELVEPLPCSPQRDEIATDPGTPSAKKASGEYRLDLPKT